MNLQLKASTFCLFFAVFALLLQTSCAATRWPSWLTGEPGREVIEAPRVVGTPSGAGDKTFPNLATVPSAAPENFSKLQERQQHVDKMLADKEKAERARARIESLPIELPSSGAIEPADSP